MKFLRSDFLLSLAATGLFSQVNGLASAKPSPGYCGLNSGIPIKSSQPLEGKDFIGAPVPTNRLHPKVQFNPRSFALHQDAANTRSQDYPGPLGHNLKVSSFDIRYAQFFWDDKGTPFAAYQGPCNGSATNFVSTFAVLNPETFLPEATWVVPPPYADTNTTLTNRTTLNFVYSQLLMETDQFVVGTRAGQVYILQIFWTARGPKIETLRVIDLSSKLKGIALLNNLMDTAGNIWFTTGDLGGASTGGAVSSYPFSIMGYVQPNGTIHTIEIPNQTIENGIALSNTTIFVVTGPSAKDDHANAIGTVRALEPSPAGVRTKWNATYQAGDGRKPGAFARGSGTTPGLLGNDFMTVTDNANVQINLNIFRQNATGADVKPVCSVPLFSPNASWTDNSLIKHFDGKDYSAAVVNMDHEILFDSKFTVGGDDGALNNNLTVQSPGVQKIFIAGDGSGCHVAWTNHQTRWNTAPALSTSTGLLYGYDQSVEASIQGEWEWYASAIDYMTGKTVWRARTGAGEPFNNYYRTAFLGPDGTFYHPVQDGVVAVKDGAKGDPKDGKCH